MHFDPDLIIIWTGIVLIVLIVNYFGAKRR